MKMNIAGGRVNWYSFPGGQFCSMYQVPEKVLSSNELFFKEAKLQKKYMGVRKNLQSENHRESNSYL